MLNNQNFQEVEERKSQFAFDLSQQKKTENIAKVSENPQNINQEERQSNIIRLCNLDEVQDDIILGNRIVDFKKYKSDRTKAGLEMLKESGFKSKLSIGNDDKFEFKNYEKDDSSRMEAVKEALKSYYSLMERKEEENDDEEDGNDRQAVMARETTEQLQLIVTNCNRYIANRWPISSEGRKRLKEVKDLRKEAIKELGEHAGHPGWRLAGEYLKFGIKAVTSPVWAPLAAVGTAAYYTGKWAGRVTKRIAKATGKMIVRKVRRFADGVADSFHSWKAFGATLAAIGAALTWGTLINVVNTAITAATVVPWILCSMVTAPRYFYLLAKGKVKLKGLSNIPSERNVRCMAWSLPTPHLYSSWFKAFYYGKVLGDYIQRREHDSDGDDLAITGIKYIHNDPSEDTSSRNARKYRSGSDDQYKTSFLGMTRDVYYHSTTLKFKKFFELFRYSEKNDFESIHQRALQDTAFYEDDYDDDDEQLQEKKDNQE